MDFSNRFLRLKIEVLLPLMITAIGALFSARQVPLGSTERSI